MIQQLQAPVYAESKRWSDRFIPCIKGILADLFIAATPEEIDQKENADLMVFSVVPFRVACRVRQADHYQGSFPFDITFRYDRPSGAQTEFAKLRDGFGHFFFYGFGLNNGQVGRWVLLDLDKFRDALTRWKGRKPKPFQNRDKSSSFLVFDTKNENVRPCIHATSPHYWENA